MTIEDLLTKQLLFELINDINIWEIIKALKNISPEVSEHIITLIEDCKHKSNQNNIFFYIKALLFNAYDKSFLIVLKTSLIEYILELSNTNMLDTNSVNLLSNYLYELKLAEYRVNGINRVH